MQKQPSRARVAAVPNGKEKLSWYGPGLLWMLSAVGTGSILFTPRVASVYRYELLWLLCLVVFFMWVMIREMARFSIATGRTMLEGFAALDGPKNWAVWVIFIPQLVAAAIGIAGLCAVVGSALFSFAPGGLTAWSVVVLGSCTAFTAAGRYSAIERASRVMALILMVAAIVAAVLVAPPPQTLLAGLKPQWPADPDLYIILPWVGTILAGSMGIVWFGYWTATRGFGGGLVSQHADDEGMGEDGESASDGESRSARLRSWNRLMTGTASLGVLGGLVVLVAFLVLGAELLAPSGILPEGPDVAVDLTELFAGVWGDAGRYLLLVAIVVAIVGSVLANQDGWGRSFADMTFILLDDDEEPRPEPLPERLSRWLHIDLTKRSVVKRLFIVTITGVIPLIILLFAEDPVRIMSASGIIAAAHTPFIALLALYVNARGLSTAVRPSRATQAAMACSGLFYFGFAALYLWRTL